MKKSLLLIPLVLLALWAGITWIIGSQTQSGFATTLKEISSKFGPTIGISSIAEESYSRGFLSSMAITKIAYQGKRQKEQKDVYLKFQVWHGPLMMTPEGLKIGAEYVLVTLAKDRLPKEALTIIDEGFNKAEPFEISLLYGFDGKIAVDAEIAPFNSSKEGEPSFKFDGLTSELKTDHNKSFAQGFIKFGALDFQDKKAGSSLSIAAAQVDVDFTNIISQLTGDGTSSVSFPEIKAAFKSGNYSLTDLHFEGSSKQTDGKLNSVSQISIGNFTGPDKGAYAEIFAKMNGSLDIKLEANGMDIESIKKMSEAQKSLADTESKDQTPDIASAKKSKRAYLNAAVTMLQPGYQLKNHIALTTKAGKSEFDVGLEYTSEKPLLELVSFRELLEAVEIALNLRIAKELLPAEAATKIQPAIGMGFIMDVNNFYKGDAILAGGELTVNGKAQPILKNMGPMLDLPIPWEKFGIKKDK